MEGIELSMLEGQRCVRDRPRICRECGHVFQGDGWNGIDAHWRAKHERVVHSEDFSKSMCKGTRVDSCSMSKTRALQAGQVPLVVAGKHVVLSQGVPSQGRALRWRAMAMSAEPSRLRSYADTSRDAEQSAVCFSPRRPTFSGETSVLFSFLVKSDIFFRPSPLLRSD